MKKFPNGFPCWHETHFEIASAIAQRAKDGPLVAPIKEYHDDMGHKGLYLLAEELTDEFEQRYKGEDWVEKDWYDTIDQFITTKLG